MKERRGRGGRGEVVRERGGRGEVVRERRGGEGEER